MDFKVPTRQQGLKAEAVVYYITVKLSVYELGLLVAEGDLLSEHIFSYAVLRKVGYGIIC